MASPAEHTTDRRPRGWNMKGLKGAAHPAWKDGRYIDTEGYVWVQALDHPWPRARGYIREHIRVMELHLGRRLLPHEVVHHRDRDKTHNEFSNLEIKHNGVHAREHRIGDGESRRRDHLGRYI